MTNSQPKTTGSQKSQFQPENAEAREARHRSPVILWLLVFVWFLPVFVNGHDPCPNEPQPPTCRVFGYLYDISGYPIEGATIIVDLLSECRFDTLAIVSPLIVTTTTDSSGYFDLQLIPTDQMICNYEEHDRYHIAITREDEIIVKRRLYVPNQKEYRLWW